MSQASKFSRKSRSSWPYFIAAGAAAGVWAVQRAARQPGQRSYEARASFAVNCTAERAYRLWRNFEDTAQFLRHVESVRVIDDTHSEWVAVGPLGKRIHWTSEIVEDRANERIAWQSLPGSEIVTRGEVEFRPRVAGRGIIVSARMDYQPPAGSASKALAMILGRHPEFTVREDLRRFKAIIEAGEVPTIAGQTHGPRGISGQMKRSVMRETSNISPPQAWAFERRIA